MFNILKDACFRLFNDLNHNAFKAKLPCLRRLRIAKKYREGNVIESEGMFTFRVGFKGDKMEIFWRDEAGCPREFLAKSELKGKEWKSTRELFERTLYLILFRDVTRAWLVPSYRRVHKTLLRSKS